LNVDDPKNCGDDGVLSLWDVDVADPKKYAQSSVFPFQMRSFWVTPVELWPFTPCHSRSLKVTGNDTDRSATYDALLLFHRNYGPISYHDDGHQCI